MDTLRILPSACRGSRMKRLIALSLLLLSPVLAGAQSSPTLEVTSGSMTLPTLYNGIISVTGNNFSLIANPIGCGPYIHPQVIQPCALTGWNLGPNNVVFAYNNTLDGTLAIGELTVDGVPIPTGGNELTLMDGSLGVVDITGPGIYKGNFTWGMEYQQRPVTVVGEGHLSFGGQGTYTLFVSRNSPGLYPGEFHGEAILTFKAPEPSTASLLLIGFGGLAILWRRRKEAQS